MSIVMIKNLRWYQLDFRKKVPHWQAKFRGEMSISVIFYILGGTKLMAKVEVSEFWRLEF